METTLREALTTYLTEKGIRSEEDPPDQLYKDDWFRFYLGHRRFRLVRLGGAIRSIAVHDAHHLLTGYGTDMRGEAELTGWELASGGCGRSKLGPTLQASNGCTSAAGASSNS